MQLDAQLRNLFRYGAQEGMGRDPIFKKRWSHSQEHYSGLQIRKFSLSSF